MPKMNLPPLPSWVDPQRLQSQQAVVSEVVDRFKGRNGHPEHDVVFLQAPTGTGKTLIAEMVRRQMMAKTIYTCSTKSLQDQFLKDFPYAKVLKGRVNYPTLLGWVDEMGDAAEGRDAVTALDCTLEDGWCRWCEDQIGECPYRRARGNASSAPLAVLNTSYLLTDAIGPQRFTRRDLLVIDECDLLEGELLNQAELHLTNRRMKRLQISPPKWKSKPETWTDWIRDHVLPRCDEYVRQRLPDPAARELDRKELRERKFMAELMQQLEFVAESIGEKWVYDGYKERDYENGDVIFRPVYVAGYGDKFVFKNARKTLLMSATILAPDVMASELGLTLDGEREYDAVDVPSVFPKENRPIHVVPIAEMTHPNLLVGEVQAKMAEAINGVLLRHPDDRILIHCVSYELAGYLHRRIRYPDGDRIRTRHNRPILTYANAGERDEALEKFLASDSSVLFAPSMDRGIDLPDDACRVMVVAKVPYPNLNDKRIKARLYSMGGQAWYSMHTIRTIVQMCGRAVRHREDYAITYILDSQFVENIWKKNSRMFPSYFREALNFRFNPRLLTEMQE